MADITISPDEIRSALKDFVAGYQPSAASKTEVGTVVDAADGIAHVEGLPGAMANELLRFADGTLGLALNLDENEIGVIVLGEFTGIEEGMEVTRTGEVLSVPVGDAYLGRVVDPLGNPIDGLGEVKAETRRALELQAPGVMQRKSVPSAKRSSSFAMAPGSPSTWAMPSAASTTVPTSVLEAALGW